MMMIMNLPARMRALLAALAVLALAAGCGGVDSGGTGTVTVAGRVGGYGSIIVNDIHFDESRAQIQDAEGRLRSPGDIRLGMTVAVDGTGQGFADEDPQAQALSIRMVSELVGRIQGVDPAGRSFTVLGQTVLITPVTLVDRRIPGGSAGLSPGLEVEVHGRYDASRARYAATRIEPRPQADAFVLRGTISAINMTSHTLVIGGQTLSFRDVPPSERPPLEVGAIVRARLAPQANSDGSWNALSLTRGVIELPDRDEARIEGRISEWQSSRQFSVNGVRVDASAARFPDGEGGVQLGARVEVEGWSSGGVLRAREVEVEGDEDEINSKYELHGPIESLDRAAQLLRVRGEEVDYSGSVEFRNGTADNLAIGRRIEVVGPASNDGTRIRAVRITFEAE